MKQANLDTNVILFSMWTEAIKNFAIITGQLAPQEERHDSSV